MSCFMCRPLISPSRTLRAELSVLRRSEGERESGQNSGTRQRNRWPFGLRALGKGILTGLPARFVAATRLDPGTRTRASGRVIFSPEAAEALETSRREIGFWLLMRGMSPTRGGIGRTLVTPLKTRARGTRRRRAGSYPYPQQVSEVHSL
jgi:hypothetical protein